MRWNVEFYVDFSEEFDKLREEIQDELLAHAGLLERFGPQLGRPTVDTLQGSSFSNMKELRFNASGGIWRVAFAFDVKRKAILLIAGDKKGKNQTKFYKDLIRLADSRFAKHSSN